MYGFGVLGNGGQGWDCYGMAALGWAVVLRRGMAVRGLVRIGGRGTVGQRRYGVASSGLAVKGDQACLGEIWRDKLSRLTH